MKKKHEAKRRRNEGSGGRNVHSAKTAELLAKQHTVTEQTIRQDGWPFLMLFLAMVSCTAPDRQAMDVPLKAPAGTPPPAVAAMDAGHSLFSAGQWDQAQAQYEHALTADPTLAEAHYDLALVLDRLGKEREALHYKEAANLAPGNRTIWNARPFRKVDADVGNSLFEKRVLHPDPQRPY